MTRPVQGTLLPEAKPERPVGPLLGSVQTGTNADLIARLAPLYLHDRTVMDTTYGLGKWWTRYRPDELIRHDLDRAKGDGVDFRALPEGDESVDVVCFDPPYLPQGGVQTSTASSFVADFGLTSCSRADLWDLIALGMAECARVARQLVIAKCCDFVNGGSFHLGHVRMIEAAVAAGLTVHDLIVHHTGAGPGGHNIFDPLRARRHHSYLIVFARPGFIPGTERARR